MKNQDRDKFSEHDAKGRITKILECAPETLESVAEKCEPHILAQLERVEVRRRSGPLYLAIAVSDPWPSPSEFLHLGYLIKARLKDSDDYKAVARESQWTALEIEVVSGTPAADARRSPPARRAHHETHAALWFLNLKE